MIRAQIDESLRSRLVEFRVPTELCDKDGRVIGVYTPIAGSDRQWYEWAKGRYSDEELEHRCNELGEKTTAEVLEALRET
ncbi:MAG TPA: hypothetical protein VGM05_05230 [Planctomycetaceae bacterium]|jgi:hypothetical protein